MDFYVYKEELKKVKKIDFYVYKEELKKVKKIDFYVYKGEDSKKRIQKSKKNGFLRI